MFSNLDTSGNDRIGANPRPITNGYPPGEIAGFHDPVALQPDRKLGISVFMVIVSDKNVRTSNNVITDMDLANRRNSRVHTNLGMRPQINMSARMCNDHRRRHKAAIVTKMNATTAVNLHPKANINALTAIGNAKAHALHPSEQVLYRLFDTHFKQLRRDSESARRRSPSYRFSRHEPWRRRQGHSRGRYRRARLATWTAKMRRSLSRTSRRCR